MKYLILASILIVGLGVGLAQAEQGMTGHFMAVPDEMKWKPGPGSLASGAEFSVIEGNPKEKGPFTMRLRLPVNYKIMPHWHPAVEHVTVISGTFYMGMGSQFDEEKAKKLTPGGFAVMAIDTRHYAFTQSEPVVLQLHGIGPWGITYVNPADDPRQ